MRRFVTTVPLFLALVLAFFLLRGMDQRVRLSRLLEDSNFTVSYGGKQYKIFRGRADGSPNRQTELKLLRLAAFYTWTKEDPLLYSPDLTTKDLPHSIDVLEKEQQELLSVIQRTKKLYPVDFLRSFTETAAFTSDFLKKPTEQKAQKLIALEKKSAALYKEEALVLLSAIDPPGKANPVSFNIQTSNETVVSDVKKIVKNADALLLEIEKREACLLGKGDCVRPALLVLRPRPKDFSLQKEPRLLPKTLFAKRRIDLVKGPYRTVSPCWGWGKDFSYPEHYFYIIERPSNSDKLGLSNDRIDLASERYYIKVDDDSVLPEYIELKRRGINYFLTAENAPYACQNREETSDVVETDLFFRTKKPLFPFMPLSKGAPKDVVDFFKEAKIQEDLFYTDKIPSYQRLLLLSDYYKYAYALLAKSSDEPFAKNLLPFQDELISRSVSIQNRLGNLQIIVDSAIRSMYGMTLREIIRPHTDETYVKGFIYTFRSIYGLTFLPFTPAVWRTDQKPEYLDKVYVTGAVGQGAYLSYFDLAKEFGVDEVRSWSRVSMTNILEELADKAKAERERK